MSGEAGERAVADVQGLPGDVPGGGRGEEQRQAGDLGGDRRGGGGDAVVARLRTAPGGDGVQRDAPDTEVTRLSGSPVRQRRLDRGFRAVFGGVVTDDVDDRTAG